MKTFDRIIQVFRAVFENEIDISNVTPDSDLRNEIGINSIGLLYMAMALEEEFNIKFTNDDLIDINTVGNVIACIEKKVGQ